MCTLDCEPTLDQRVEVTFTISPRVRRIAAHDPIRFHCGIMPPDLLESRIEFPDDLETLRKGDARRDRAPGWRKGAMSLQIPQGTAIVFDPVTHTSLFLEVAGEATRERQTLTLAFDDAHAHSVRLKIQPGPVRLPFENKTERRTLPRIWLLSEAMHKLRTVGGRSSPRDTCSATRRSATSIAPTLDRAAAQDHEPDLPVHRSQGLDRALRPHRRSRRLRFRARSFRRAARGGLRRERRRGQDHRRRGDGDFPDSGSGAAAALRMREAMRNSTRRAARGHGAQDRHPRARASPSRSTIGRTISARPSTSPRA